MYKLDIHARSRLKELRTTRGLSIRDIHRETGLGRATIQRAHDCSLPGEVVPVHPTTLRKLAELYRVSIPFILRGFEEQTEPGRTRPQAVHDPVQRARRVRRLRIQGTLAALTLVVAASAFVLHRATGDLALGTPSTLIVGGGPRLLQIAESRSGRVLYERVFSSDIDLRLLTPWENSVLVSYRGSESECCRIELWDYETGRLRWENTIGREVFEPVFGDVAWESGVRSWDLRFADLHGDGEPEAVALLRQITHHPCLIRVFDAQGTVLGNYFHRGYFYDVVADDLDGDGKDEILLGGTNNTSNGATIAILDENHLDGRVDAGLGSDPGFDGSVVRLLFPPFSDELMGLLHLDRLRAGGFVVGREDDGEIRLRCILGDPRAPVFLTMDGSLRPLSFSSHDHLSNMAQVWTRQGQLHGEFGTHESILSWINSHQRFEEGESVETPTLTSPTIAVVY